MSLGIPNKIGNHARFLGTSVFSDNQLSLRAIRRPQGTAARLFNMLSFYHVLSTLSAIPNVTLNNGVIMPMISAGTWQYDGPTAEQVVKLRYRSATITLTQPMTTTTK